MGAIVGKSEVASPDKHDGFEKWVDLHCKIVRRVFDKPRTGKWEPLRKYLYIDTHAGGGPDCYGLGSPVCFMNAILKHELDFDAHFIERESANVAGLERAGLSAHRHTTIHHGDNKIVVPDILKSTPPEVYGLVYMDPNGCPDVELREQITRSKKYVDIMVRVNSSAMKRARCAHGGNSLMDVLGIPKAKWLIREPLESDKWQWTFLFGTNYTLWNQWKGQRFYATDSLEGGRILEKLNFTKAETAAMRKENTDILEAVWARSNGICEKCGQRRAEEIHHWRYEPPVGAADLFHVCHQCHCDIEGVDS